MTMDSPDTSHQILKHFHKKVKSSFIQKNETWKCTANASELSLKGIQAFNPCTYKNCLIKLEHYRYSEEQKNYAKLQRKSHLGMQK
jgi:hypothetical protein